MSTSASAAAPAGGGGGDAPVEWSEYNPYLADQRTGERMHARVLLHRLSRRVAVAPLQRMRSLKRAHSVRQSGSLRRSLSSSSSSSAPPSSPPAAGSASPHALAASHGSADAPLWAEFEAEARKHRMSVLYAAACAKFAKTPDAALVAEMDAANSAELASLEARITSCEERESEQDLLDALLALADAHARMGDAVAANAALDRAKAKHMSSGLAIDVQLRRARLAVSAFIDAAAAAATGVEVKQLAATVATAKDMVEKGGDWDRRNRLKIYEAVLLMVQRDLRGAATLLLDSLATFTSFDVMTFESFVFYTVICGVLTLDRTAIKAKLVDCPEVISVAVEIGAASKLLGAFYECRYADFFDALLGVHEQILEDRFLAPHATYFVREMRVKAYQQFLEPYRTVTIGTMAAAFGIEPQMIDAELFRFIAAGRIHAKIDRVTGVVQTMPRDVRVEQYRTVIRTGDALLNRVQKLARVITL